MKRAVTLKYYPPGMHDTGMSGFVPVSAPQFDPFYSVDGIFHDVFEHYFEGEHKYFSNENKCTVYGEMVAIGHKLYFYDKLGINSFRYRRFSASPSTWREDTEPLLEEYFSENYTNYDIENCCIPYQKPIYGSCIGIEGIIEDYQSRLKEISTDARVKPAYIANAYRYGWRMAEREWGHDWHSSHNLLDHFLETWNRILDGRNEDSLFMVFNDDYSPIEQITFKIDSLKPYCHYFVKDLYGNCRKNPILVKL